MANNIQELLKVRSSHLDEKSSKISNAKKSNEQSEFEKILNEKSETKNNNDDGLKVSTHAMKRLQERSIEMDGDELLKLRDAVNKLKLKGGKESLVLTGKAAYIVDVPKNTIVTAMDKKNLADNVFTKIDSTLIME